MLIESIDSIAYKYKANNYALYWHVKYPNYIAPIN